MGDGRGGTGERAKRFGDGLTSLIAERNQSADEVAAQADVDPARLRGYLDNTGGEPRVADMARLCLAFELDPLDFLHRTGYLSDVDYAMGLDPLFFLAEGGARSMMRIALRERHNNPKPIEGENVIRRNSVIRALQDDALIDPAAAIELQMRYLLLAASNAGWMEEPPG
jgi:hypothetical protein